MSDSGVCSDRGRGADASARGCSVDEHDGATADAVGCAGSTGGLGLSLHHALERPASLADKEFLTEEEAANLEQEAVDRNERLLHEPAERAQPTRSLEARPDGKPGFYNNFWLDEGTTTVGTRRTSLIVDPPEGKIPPLTPAAQEKQAAIGEARRGVTFHAPTPGGGVEDLGRGGLQLRCIMGQTPDRR